MNRNLEIMRLMTYYLNPCTLLLVIMGVIFAQEPVETTYMALGMAAVITIFNFITLGYALKHPDSFKNTQMVRVLFNYMANVLLVFVMYPYWQPIWLVFLLTLIGISAITSRMNTVVNAVFMSVMLLWILYMREMLHGAALGQGLTYIVLFFLASLFINSMVTVNYQHLAGYEQYPMPSDSKPDDKRS